MIFYVKSTFVSCDFGSCMIGNVALRFVQRVTGEDNTKYPRGEELAGRAMYWD